MVCVWAIKNKRIPYSRRTNLVDSKWLNTGNNQDWKSYKQGKSYLNPHAGYDHDEAWRIYQMELNKSKVDNTRRDEITINRTGLRAVIDSVITCGTQGIALRGHGDEKETGNVWNMVHLISRFNEDAKMYFSGSESKIKFLSTEIQNQMLKTMEDKLTNFFLAKIRQESSAGNAKKKSRFFNSIIMDETQDIRRREHVSVCIRYFNAQMLSEELFFCFSHTKTTDANTLLDLLKLTLQVLKLPF